MVRDGKPWGDWQSDSSASECGHLKLWVTCLFSNRIPFMGSGHRSLAMKGFPTKASSPDRQFHPTISTSGWLSVPTGQNTG